MNPKNIFDYSIIQDHNDQGFDSVDSEDFDSGFGCVVINNTPTYVSPDMPQGKWSANDQWNYEQARRRESEIEAEEDEYLKQHGIY